MDLGLMEDLNDRDGSEMDACVSDVNFETGSKDCQDDSASVLGEAISSEGASSSEDVVGIKVSSELALGDDSGRIAEQSIESKESEKDSVGFCPKCGMPAKEGLPFCGNCGAKLIAAEESSAGPSLKRKFGPKTIVGLVLVAVVVIAAGVAVRVMTAAPSELVEWGRYEAAYDRADGDAKQDILSEIIGVGEYRIAYDLASDEEKSGVISEIIEVGEYQVAYDLAGDGEKPGVISEIIGVGGFQAAYDVATEEMKQGILVANLAAVVSNDVIDNLKDPDSYVLREIYFDGDSYEMVLRVSANNSYSAKVSNWYYYTFEEDDGEYQLYTSVSDLEDETIYKYADDFDEKLEKILKNAARESIRSIISDEENKLDDVYVNVVNDLFESGGLDEVGLASSIVEIYPGEATVSVRRLSAGAFRGISNFCDD